MGSKLTMTPVPQVHGRLAGAVAGRSGPARGVDGAGPAPFLFPGGEDDIFRDPFGEFAPSGR